MKLSILVAGAAATALIAGSASAMTKSAYAEPTQPVPYGQLNSYMKATPHQRTAMMSGAQTGSSVNTSAAMPTAGADTSTNAAAATAAPGDATTTGASVNTTTSTPSATVTPGADTSAVPNSAAPMPGTPNTGGPAAPTTGSPAN